MPWWLPLFKRNYRRDGFSSEETSVVRWSNLLCLLIFFPSLFGMMEVIVRHYGSGAMHSMWLLLPLAVLYIASAYLSGFLLRLFAPVLFRRADANAKTRLAGALRR
jgi:hypothetical protein